LTCGGRIQLDTHQADAELLTPCSKWELPVIPVDPIVMVTCCDLPEDRARNHHSYAAVSAGSRAGCQRQSDERKGEAIMKELLQQGKIPPDVAQ